MSLNFELKTQDNDMENIPIDTTKKMLELVRSDYIMKLKKEYRSE